MTLVELRKGDSFDGLVRIEDMKKPGPFIYSVSDGTASIEAVTHSIEAQVGDVVRVKGVVEERKGHKQIRISLMQKEDVPFEEVVRANQKSQERTLSISSSILEEGKNTMTEIAQKLREAAQQGTTLLIRAHGDADGITGWVSLHRALAAQNPSSRIFTNISKLPFYQYDDALRDLSLLTRSRDSMLILVDNGSTRDDTDACKLISSAGIPVVVIDHHAPIDEESEGRMLHLSPHQFGGDENIPAGALAYEVARQIDPHMEDPLLPAIACAGDKCEGDAAESYIQQSGKARDELVRYGRAIDFLAFHLRFDSPLHLYERLLRDSEFSHEVMAHAEALVTKAMQKQHLRKEHINDTLLCQFDVDAEGFPPAGKIVGSVFESLKEEEQDVVVIGMMENLLIMRSTLPLLPQWHEATQKLATTSGGGHPKAGTLRVDSPSQALDTLRDLIQNTHTHARD